MRASDRHRALPPCPLAPTLVALASLLACSGPPAPSEAEPPAAPPPPPTPAPAPPAATGGASPAPEPDAPARPFGPSPRLVLGTTAFYAPVPVRAIALDAARVFVGRDGPRVDVFDLGGTSLMQLELAGPPGAGAALGPPTSAGDSGMVQALDARSGRLAVALGTGGARVLDVETGAEVFSVRGLDLVHDVALLPDGGLATAHGGEAFANGHRIVEARGECGLCVWSPAGERVATVSPAEVGGWATALALAPDGAALALGTSGGRIRVHDLRGALVRELRAGDRRIERVAFVDGGGTLRYGDDAGGIASVALDGSGRRALASSDEVTGAVALSGARLAWASRSGALRVLDGSGGPLGRLTRTGLTALALDGLDVLVGDATGHVRRWHDGTLGEPATPSGGVDEIGYDEAGARLVVRSGTELRVYRAEDGALEAGPRSLPDFVGATALRAGDRLVVQRDALSLREEDLLDGAHARGVGSGRGESIGHLAVSGDRRVLAWATYDRIHVGSAALRVEGGIRALAPSDDGAAIAVATQGVPPRLAVLLVATGAERWSVQLPEIASALAWRAGTLALVLAESGVVEARSAEDGTLRARIAPPEDEGGEVAARPSAIALSADGALLAVGADRGGLLLWDLGAGALRWRGHGHAGPVAALAFRPAGAELASASRDGTVRVWPLGGE